MRAFRLIYNPYTVETRLYERMPGGDIAVDEDSPLAAILWEHMREWLPAHGAWRGFFAELAQAAGDRELEISFEGTRDDFDALSAAALLAKEESGLWVELRHTSDVKNILRENNRRKLEKVRAYLAYAKSPGRADSLSQRIMGYVERAWDPCYTVNVAGAAAREKAWLQNRLVGQSVLPESGSGQNGIAVRIEIDSSREDFQVSSISRGGMARRHLQRPVSDCVEQLLREQGTWGPGGRKDWYGSLCLEGPAPRLKDCEMKLVLQDDRKEGELTEEALERGDLTVLVLGGGAPGREETGKALRAFSGAAKMSKRKNQEGFLIVCVSDEERSAKETEKAARRVLESRGLAGIKVLTAGAWQPEEEGVAALASAILDYEKHYAIPGAIQSFYSRMRDQLTEAEREQDEEEQRRWLSNLRGGLEALVEVE